MKIFTTATNLLRIAVIYLLYSTAPASTQELLRGFTATPDPKAAAFQPLLNDTTNTFSLSFLRVNRGHLALAVIHLPSGEPLWTANTTGSPRWSRPTRFTFDGGLVISDNRTGVFWSTNTNGDRVRISNSSNLQIWKDPSSLLWQSFDSPSDTIVENQNFTAAMALDSSNGLYTLRLGPNFIALYAKFNFDKQQIYYKHGALQAKASIIQGHGPIHIRITSDGYLGMYQNGSVPADVQTFISYQRSVPRIRRVRIQDDGNLVGHYWSGSGWVLDYEAIRDPCDLPSPCGSYGLCRNENGSNRCSCLDNQTDPRGGACYPGQSGDFCGVAEDYWVLRKAGVELPYKQLMGYFETTSLVLCERSCEENCTCWGAVYNNASGFCYTLDYPIQTLVAAGDVSKVGYFKVRVGAGKRFKAGLGIGLGILCGAVLVLVMFGWFRVCRRRSGKVNRYLDEEEIVAPGPYKDLRSSSIELSNR